MGRLSKSLILFCFGLIACGGGGSGGDDEPDGIVVRRELVAAGFDFPLFLTTPPEDTARLFIVEKTGRIRIIRDGAVLPSAFLDLSAQVSSGSEQGLLGLAFHPQYNVNGRFFINYTDRGGDTRVVEYKVSANPDLADATSAREILSIDQPFPNHNGGQVTFGPDGYLYISSGDGGDAGDPQGNGQDLSDLLGSLLRIDVDAGSPYAIPSDNPFVNVSGARPEIWNFGLRNPWRFSFDRETQALYIGDVGQGEREEIDVAPASSGGGKNYGWNVMEGLSCFNTPTCDQSGFTLPVFDYDHDEGCAVTGGYVYRGARIPALQGQYFYGDFCSGFVRSFRFDGAATDHRLWPTLSGGSITSFGEDTIGELYILVASGEVFRLASG